MPSGMELVTRAAQFIEEIKGELQKVRFLVVRVEKAGGTHRIVRSLLNSLSTGDGISLRAGVVMSFALFDFRGSLLHAGLGRQRSGFEPVSPPRTGKTWFAVLGVLLAGIMYNVTWRLAGVDSVPAHRVHASGPSWVRGAVLEFKRGPNSPHSAQAVTILFILDRHNFEPSVWCRLQLVDPDIMRCIR